LAYILLCRIVHSWYSHLQKSQNWADILILNLPIFRKYFPLQHCQYLPYILLYCP
jgi:type II secretory pathway component PulF